MNLNEQVDSSNIYKKTWTNKQIFKIFCGIMIFGICLFLVSLLFLGFDRWRYLFFILVDSGDSFMDFFNPIAWAGSNILELAYQHNGNLYPPIIVLLTGALGNNFPEIFLNSMRGLRFLNYPLATISVLLFLSFSSSLYFSLLWSTKTGSRIVKTIFCILILFSAPFLHWFERANYIIFAVIFSFLFVIFYNNSKKYIRHLALCSLALAINIKIYPAVLGLLLIKDKKFKEITYLGIYTAFLFFVPLIWLGGIKSIYLLVNNLMFGTNDSTLKGYGYSLSLLSTCKMLVYSIFKTEYLILNKIFYYISITILPIGAFCAYIIKSKWKALAILCLLMILIPQISYSYVLLFMVIPLCCFLNEKKDYVFKDLIYLLLFCLIFMLNIPMQVPIHMPIGHPVLMDNFCARLSMLVMFCMLCQEGINNCIIQMKLWKKK